jgi:hypothetical protein
VDAQKQPNMQKIASTAERLRAVRQAHRHFLTLWTLQCLIERPAALDRMASDLAATRDGGETNGPSHWAFLYRGSVLDD